MEVHRQYSGGGDIYIVYMGVSMEKPTWGDRIAATGYSIRSRFRPQEPRITPLWYRTVSNMVAREVPWVQFTSGRRLTERAFSRGNQELPRRVGVMALDTKVLARQWSEVPQAVFGLAKPIHDAVVFAPFPSHVLLDLRYPHLKALPGHLVMGVLVPDESVVRATPALQLPNKQLVIPHRGITPLELSNITSVPCSARVYE